MRNALILVVTIIPLILLGLFLINQAFASDAYPVEFPNTGNVFVKVEGKSMEPTIKDGEFVKCLSETEYKSGDIVAFSNGEVLVSHRIIAYVSGKLITKGDGNLIPDIGLLDKNQIFCKLTL